MKIYAKQVPTEYQESPLFFGDWPDGVILDGNRDYNSHTTELYDRIMQAYDEAAQEIESLDTRDGYAAYNNATEAINDYFPPLEYREKPYSTRDIHAIREALRMYGTSDYYSGRYITAMLDAITGGNWKNGTIRGCCQGDWQHIIYNANDWSRADIDILETEYFNTGAEWRISENDPESDDCYYFYSHEWSEDGIRAEIAAAAGVDPSDVILYTFTGWSKTPVYEEVS